MKKEYFDMLTDLLTANAAILNEGYKVQYEKNYGFLIAFPPQVYELLKRFSPKLTEYTSYTVKSADAGRAATQ